MLRPIDFSPPAEVNVNIEFSVSSETNFSDSNITGGIESAVAVELVFWAGLVCFVEGLIDGELTTLVWPSGL